MTGKEQQPFYVSPKVKTIEIKTQAIICQSGGEYSVGDYNNPFRDQENL